MPGSFQNSGAIDAQGSGGGLFGGRMVTQAWNMDILGLESTLEATHIPHEEGAATSRDQELDLTGLKAGNLSKSSC